MLKDKKTGDFFRRVLPVSSIGIVLVVSIVISSLFGYWLDGKIGTKPYCTVFFLLIGVASGVKSAYMFMKRAGVFDNIDRVDGVDKSNDVEKDR
ncbi:hypothetical protein RsTz2092_07860 [Deferribacterales bacterium RsTz2092]|nr:hypothetical protein AGMMS49941_05190 [Deferribacterales bacterium]